MSSVAHPALTGRHGVAHILTVNLPISSCALRANRAISCIRARTLLAFWGAKLPRGPFQYFAELCWEESKMSSVAPIPLTLEAPVALRVVDPRIGRALRFMEARLHTSLSVADMASEAGLSPSRFSHLFRSEVDVSPAKALLRMRIMRVALCANLSSPLRTITFNYTAGQ